MTSARTATDLLADLAAGRARPEFYRLPPDGSRHMVAQVKISVGYKGGGGHEFGIRWYQLRDQGVAPRLELFHDAWMLLAVFPQLLPALVALGPYPSPGTVCGLLARLGFTDTTPAGIYDHDVNGYALVSSASSQHYIDTGHYLAPGEELPS